MWAPTIGFNTCSRHQRRRELLLLVFLASICVTLAGKNPCHPAAHKATPAYACSKITIPNGMCSACNVGSYTNRGAYSDCTRTTTVETPQCLAKFKEYLELNPCDTTRVAAYNMYKSSNAIEKEEGRSKIDYYLYSVCEQSKCEERKCRQHRSQLTLGFQTRL